MSSGIRLGSPFSKSLIVNVRKTWRKEESSDLTSVSLFSFLLAPLNCHDTLLVHQKSSIHQHHHRQLKEHNFFPTVLAFLPVCHYHHLHYRSRSSLLNAIVLQHLSPFPFSTPDMSHLLILRYDHHHLFHPGFLPFFSPFSHENIKARNR